MAAVVALQLSADTSAAAGGGGVAAAGGGSAMAAAISGAMGGAGGLAGFGGGGGGGGFGEGLPMYSGHGLSLLLRHQLIVLAHTDLLRVCHGHEANVTASTLELLDLVGSLADETLDAPLVDGARLLCVGGRGRGDTQTLTAGDDLDAAREAVGRAVWLEGTGGGEPGGL